MASISPKAVILGGILDIVLTNASALPVGVYAAIRAKTYELPKAQQSQAVLDAMTSDPAIFTTGMIVGSLCSVVAGYVAAKLAKRDAVLHGALASWLCLAFSIYAMIASNTPIPLWAHLIFLPMSPALGAIGGHLWLRRNP
jgi:hypothetical protein